MKSKINTYQENFIAGIRMLMAKVPELDTIPKIAEYLDMKYMALYKVMDGTNNPTTELCIRLCQKAGYSANWMFLNHGVMYLEEEQTLFHLTKEVATIRTLLENQMATSAAFGGALGVNKKINTGRREIQKRSSLKS